MVFGALREKSTNVSVRGMLETEHGLQGGEKKREKRWGLGLD